MSPETIEPDNPHFWMDYAVNDLRMAREGAEKGYRLEALCYHAQQAAEKALKAVFIFHRRPFPKTHDLEKWMALLPPSFSIPPRLRQAKDLSDYSEIGRYPHGFEAVTSKEYQRAVELAQAVVDWVDKILSKNDSPGFFEPPSAQESPVIYRAGKTKVRTRKKAKR
ncbi:MAG TPA: HEPN domain-containing protein [bacterium]|nr:HEPN domain-containing protein [bacterium]